jgi:hypothetical protein
MDKARHPQVVRTWVVERTKVLCRPPQPSKLRPEPRRGPAKNPRRPGPAPKGG